MRTTLIPVLLASVLGLAACAGDGRRGEALPVIPLQPEGIAPLIASHSGQKAVLVNVWATWCVPCVEEFPHLVELREKYKDRLEVVFISADFDDELDRVQQFLTDQGVDWQTYIKDGKDEPFILAIHPDWSGALPATAVYDASGQPVTFFEQPADYETFERYILQALQTDTP